MAQTIHIRDWVGGIEISDIGPWAYELPWHLPHQADTIVKQIIATSPTDGWHASDQILVHESATIEAGVTIKGPAIVGPNCFIAANGYLRGGVWLQKNSTVGPSCEVKSSFIFDGAKIAHLSFIGDSIIGARANIEAGVVIANHRNENQNKEICLNIDNQIFNTGMVKFGALVGDAARIGANAVIAPGALIEAGAIVPRLALIDQQPGGGAIRS